MRRRHHSGMSDYRAGYPGQKDDPDAKQNYLFFSNKIKSTPRGDLITDFHKNWRGNYDVLEVHHGFVQWLFPIREHGMNAAAQPLTTFEAKKIASTPLLQRRALENYSLMLDFYGLEVVDMRLPKDGGTGALRRLPHGNAYKVRYNNLLSHPHNNLRITRILKFMGEVGMESLKYPFLYQLILETCHTRELVDLLDSLMAYWVETVKDDEVRRNMVVFARRLKADGPPAKHPEFIVPAMDAMQLFLENGGKTPLRAPQKAAATSSPQKKSQPVKDLAAADPTSELPMLSKKASTILNEASANGGPAAATSPSKAPLAKQPSMNLAEAAGLTSSAFLKPTAKGKTHYSVYLHGSLLLGIDDMEAAKEKLKRIRRILASGLAVEVKGGLNGMIALCRPDSAEASENGGELPAKKAKKQEEPSQPVVLVGHPLATGNNEELEAAFEHQLQTLKAKLGAKLNPQSMPLVVFIDWLVESYKAGAPVDPTAFEA